MGRSALAGVVMTVALAAAACAVAPAPLPVRDTSGAATVREPCAASAMRSCALPYPSDEFTQPDGSTATGRSVVMPEELVPVSVRDQLGPGASVKDAFGDADGFSAVGPVIFELDRAVDPATLPSNGGDVLAVFDLGTGERVPVRAEVTPDAIRQGAPNTIVTAWPSVRWEEGHSYVARVTTGLGALFGELVRSPGVTTGASTYLRSIRDDLARVEGDRWAQVVSVTRFTVRSDRNAARPLEQMAVIARSQDHPVRNLTVLPAMWVDGASAIVQGEVSLSDFRDVNGVADPANGPVASWEKFLMVLPERAAGSSGAPVVMYGHGLTVAKETMLAVASTNARAGLATVGIDIPNHGDRQADEGGYLLDLTSPRLFGRLASMPLQGIVDHVSFLGAITDHLAGLDLGPWRPDGAHGDGVADLDTTRVLYEGTSMGGILGAAAVALMPEIQGAYLQVAGTGISDTIFHSLVWPLFASVVPEGSAGDAAALTGAAAMLLDRSDNVNLLERLRTSETPVFLQYGTGDGIVPNHVSERMMALLGLPLIGSWAAPLALAREGIELQRTGADAIPADGRGAVQVFHSNSSWELMGFLAHVSFIEPRAEVVLADWLQNRLVAMGLADR